MRGMTPEHIQGDRILLDGDTIQQIICSLNLVPHTPGNPRLISMLETRLRELRSALISYAQPCADDYSVLELLYETGVLHQSDDGKRHKSDLPLIRSWTDKERRAAVTYAASIKASATSSLRKYNFAPDQRPAFLKDVR